MDSSPRDPPEAEAQAPLKQAKALLARKNRPISVWPSLTAAFLFALSAVVFAVVVILAPTPFRS